MNLKTLYKWFFAPKTTSIQTHQEVIDPNNFTSQANLPTAKSSIVFYNQCSCINKEQLKFNLKNSQLYYNKNGKYKIVKCKNTIINKYAI